MVSRQEHLQQHLVLPGLERPTLPPEYLRRVLPGRHLASLLVHHRLGLLRNHHDALLHNLRVSLQDNPLGSQQGNHPANQVRRLQALRALHTLERLTRPQGVRQLHPQEGPRLIPLICHQDNRLLNLHANHQVSLPVPQQARVDIQPANLLGSLHASPLRSLQASHLVSRRVNLRQLTMQW